MKILILSREFEHSNNACGICLYNLADEFCKRGDEVHVISLVPTLQSFIYDERLEVVEILEDSFTTRCNNIKYEKSKLKIMIFRLYQIIRYVWAFFLYPNTAIFKTKELYKCAKQIVTLNSIDMVIGSYTPFETISAAVLLKKWNPRLQLVNYHLDPLLAPGNTSKLFSWYKHKRAKSSVLTELQYANKVLIPETFISLYPLSKKLSPVGFPLYIPNTIKSERSYFDKGSINIVYVGTLDSYNRNIDYTIALIESLVARGLSLKLHIWGCLIDRETKESVSNSEVAIYHGMVDSKEIPSILQSADILLNVCNETHNTSLPSKIFQLFATGKPILVIKRNENDSSLPYFEKYGNVCYAQEGNNTPEVINSVESFVKRKTCISVLDQNDIFYKYTPSYICDLINS